MKRERWEVRGERCTPSIFTGRSVTPEALENHECFYDQYLNQVSLAQATCIESERSDADSPRRESGQSQVSPQ